VAGVFRQGRKKKREAVRTLKGRRSTFKSTGFREERKETTRKCPESKKEKLRQPGKKPPPPPPPPQKPPPPPTGKTTPQAQILFTPTQWRGGRKNAHPAHWGEGGRGGGGGGGRFLLEGVENQRGRTEGESLKGEFPLILPWRKPANLKILRGRKKKGFTYRKAQGMLSSKKKKTTVVFALTNRQRRKEEEKKKEEEGEKR